MARPQNPDAFAAQRARILRAAAICIRRSGFHGAGIAAICAEAGISPGRLYHYFSDKADLIATLVTEAQQEERAALAPLTKLTEPGYSTGLIDQCVRMALRAADPEYAALSLEISAEATRDSRIAQAVAGYDRGLRDAWSSAIAKGQALGAVPSEPPPENLAGLVMLVLDGATGLRIADPHLSDADIAARIRLLLAPHFFGTI